MNDMTFTPAKSWAGALKRSRNGEGRRNLVIQLNTIVDETITMINKYEDTEFLPLIVNTFSRAKMGLNNLLSTYANKAETIASLKVLLLNIEMTLEKHKTLLVGHYPPPKTNSINIPGSKSSSISSSPSDTAYGISPITDNTDPR